MEHEIKKVPVTFEDGKPGEMELHFPIKTKDKVYIVGCAGSKDIVPWDDPDAEYWGVNNLYGVKLPGAHFDRWFEIHNIWHDNRSGKILRRGKNDFRGQLVHDYLTGLGKIGCSVYMQKHWSNLVPLSIPYPLNDIIHFFANHPTVKIDLPQCRYLTNTITYEIVLAIKNQHLHSPVYF